MIPNRQEFNRKSASRTEHTIYIMCIEIKTKVNTVSDAYKTHASLTLYLHRFQTLTLLEENDI